MDRKSLRRQLVLVLLLAGVAYLWWQSKFPSRYAEWTEDLDSQGMPAAWTDDSLDWSGVDRISYHADSVSQTIAQQTAGGIHHFRMEELQGDSLIRRVSLQLNRQTHILRLTVWSSAEGQIEVHPRGDSAYYQIKNDSTNAYWIPWPGDAVYYGAVIPVAVLWPATGGLAQATVVKIDLKKHVVLQLPAVFARPDDSTIRVTASGRSLITATYAADRTLRSLCLGKKRCWTPQATHTTATGP